MAEYCGECAHLDLKNKERYTSKDRYYCDECHRYQELTEKSCYKFMRDPSRGKEEGGYTPSGCYITTIVVNTLGLSDNCEILNTLREFRDKVLKVSPEYLNILLEYDNIGPIISKKIEEYNQRFSVCILLMDAFLIPCVKAIKDLDYESAIRIYKTMVENLKSFFKIEEDYQMPSQEEIASIDYETLGKGRIRTPKLVTD